MWRGILRSFAVVALLLGLCGTAQAEPWPAPGELEVNDFAGLLPREAAARIRAELSDLRARTGIEAVLVTLPTRADYDPAPSLEAFATRLFNGWGIGDATRNDGILILILAEDREMRIELGAGYSPEYDIPAQDVIDRVMLPAFREGRMAEGIEAGVGAVITKIAERHAAGLAPAPAPRSWAGALPFALFAGAAAFLVLRGRVWRLGGRLARCPSCGHRGILRDEVVEEAATATASGRGLRRQSCPACGWRESRPYAIAARGPGGSGGGFGGGRSSGGGASGRW